MNDKPSPRESTEGFLYADSLLGDLLILRHISGFLA